MKSSRSWAGTRSQGIKDLQYWGLLLSAAGELAELPGVADETLEMAEVIGVPDLSAMAHCTAGVIC